MDQQEWLAWQSEEHRPHLRAVAYRMLGSTSEVDATMDILLDPARLARLDLTDFASRL